MILKERPGAYVTLGTLPTPILVVPHLNRAESYFLKFGKIMMMIMGYSLLIIPIVVPFFLLTMPKETCQHEDDVLDGSTPSSVMDDVDFDQDN